MKKKDMKGVQVGVADPADNFQISKGKIAIAKL